ncbi:hypothetical protein GCM10028862_19980 [Luteimonas pelagia]
MIPRLPVEAIRAAVDGDDWAGADALLLAHEREVRAALSRDGAVAADPAGWSRLLVAQCALASELEERRAEASRRLGDLGQGRRVALAYLAGAGG